MMRPSSLDEFGGFDNEPRPSWSAVWHIWTITIPRRSINGSLVWGRVWRRHDGRSWIYKTIAEAEQH
jgi:hypothetical protein